MESHLLQMRGLKHYADDVSDSNEKSHLLQMRGLKQRDYTILPSPSGRIFYRCVD